LLTCRRDNRRDLRWARQIKRARRDRDDAVPRQPVYELRQFGAARRLLHLRVDLLLIIILRLLLRLSKLLLLPQLHLLLKARLLLPGVLLLGLLSPDRVC
jgi:hypothetical protein